MRLDLWNSPQGQLMRERATAYLDEPCQVTTGTRGRFVRERPGHASRLAVLSADKAVGRRLR
jgi:hypothetical protein